MACILIDVFSLGHDAHKDSTTAADLAIGAILNRLWFVFGVKERAC